jgi:hypothetical protein
MKRLTLTLAALCLSYPAQAFEIEYPEHFDRKRKPEVRAFIQRHKPQAPKVITKTVIVEAQKPKPEPRCKPYVTAIGDSAKSEAAARLESQKAWKAMVAFNAGQKFMDLNNADNIEYLCGPSSVPRFGGLIEGAASKFLPITDFTCQISAQPCLLPVQREAGK